MTDAALASPSARRGSPLSFLWHRRLERYPDAGPRIFYLSIVVVATIVLYYELYVQGAVAPSIISQYHMSFTYYVDVVVVANALGAFSSLIAGLADRWGRANLVTYGLVITAALVLWGLPNAPNKWTYGILLGAVGFVEGIILVATPALVRDFSPQLGRASAMGFWTLGPVIGSLVVAEVATHTLAAGATPPWRGQFVICGIVGLVVSVIAIVGLRELSPQLRDQLMVSIRDRALVEARARGLDISDSLRRPWRQMLHLDIIGSALAISVLLLIYYTAVGFFVIYFESIFGFTANQANGIGNWFWAFDAGALIVVGIVSDRLLVRKPFMIIGGIGSVVMTIIFLTRATHPHTGYYTFVWMISVLAVFLAIAFAPWMASFTETVEKRNPALTATGLAVWGWIIRAVVAVSAFVLPFVVSSMTPLVTYGAPVQAALAKVEAAKPVKVPYASTPQPLLTVVQGHAQVFASLAKYTNPKSIPASVLDPAIAAVGIPALLAAQQYTVPLGVLAAHGSAVLGASKAAPGQWQNWYWVCVAGEAVFIPLVFVMTGRWRPKRAREDARRHEELVASELAKLSAAAPAKTESVAGAGNVA
ncbi:MAG: MFS transporter [Actinomycetota bacterium]|jgi:MFS family permease|nr:MFS transporter [Actinomycetota bacterium]MDA8281154.1 MFS transporter [Actinomycetota bacterium]